MRRSEHLLCYEVSECSQEVMLFEAVRLVGYHQNRVA